MNKTGYRKIILLLANLCLLLLMNTAGGVAEAAGSETVMVPNIIGMTAKEASEKLLALGFKYETSYKKTDNLSLGDKVYKQHPYPGSKVEKGKIVYLSAYEYKKAEEIRNVPNVVGLDDNTASPTLFKAGFPYKHEFSSSSDPATFGKVSKQSPAAGTSAPKGTKVTIWVGEK